MNHKTPTKFWLAGIIIVVLTGFAISIFFPPAKTLGQCGSTAGGNVIQNPGFESGGSSWVFFSDAQATFATTSANAYECGAQAEVSIQARGSNVQLYQAGLTLQPSTTYRLSLAARSTSGADIRVFVHQHGRPFTTYGLNGVNFDLSSDWQVFTIDFPVENISAPVNDGRLRIWLSDSNLPGETYYFDQISLAPISTIPSPATETPTASPTTKPTETPLPTNTSTPLPTNTAVPTATQTATIPPTSTPTPVPTQTATATNTPVPPTTTATPTSTPSGSAGGNPCRGSAIGNVVQNSGFELGAGAWNFYSDAQATFSTTTTNPYDCERAAEIAIQTRGTNVQLFQTGIPLQPSTTYQLTMAARSTTGLDAQLFLQRHTQPFTNYGLNGPVLDLSSEWQLFEVTFTTLNFTTPVSDGRLRIWLSNTNQAGETYYFDYIALVPIATSNPTATSTAAPSATATISATSTPSATATATSVASATATRTPTATATQTPVPTATTTHTATPTAIPTLTATPTPTATGPSGPAPCSDPISGNNVLNPSFESGTTGWSFYSNAQAVFTTTTVGPYDCVRVAEVAIQTRGSNVQLFQAGLPLQPRTTYRLTMAARSTTGRDVQLFLQRHTSPFTDYGLNGTNLDLGATWQTFEIVFTTQNFTSPTSDSRLRIWLSETNQPGEVYYFDRIALVPLTNGSTATATPQSPATKTATPTPTQTTVPTATFTAVPTATNTPVPTATNTPIPPPTDSPSELVIFDWNKPVTTEHRGFPWDQEGNILHNRNLISPINYAEGTFYYRAEIRNMPSPKDMRLQFCIWQPAANDTTKPYKDPTKLENCGRQQAISYAGQKVVVTWNQKVQDLWKKNGVIIDWSRPRYRNGVAIRNSAGEVVSNYSGWNWNGEDPNKWYPMDMRFTVVMVEKGKSFGGWDKYIK